MNSTRVTPVTFRPSSFDMSANPQEICGKCGADIDPNRRVDFTLKNGTRVCDSCFVKETPRPTHPKAEWPS